MNDRPAYPSLPLPQREPPAPVAVDAPPGESTDPAPREALIGVDFIINKDTIGA
jgi:hypothetical protein